MIVMKILNRHFFSYENPKQTFKIDKSYFFNKKIDFKIKKLKH